MIWPQVSPSFRKQRLTDVCMSTLTQSGTPAQSSRHFSSERHKARVFGSS